MSGDQRDEAALGDLLEALIDYRGKTPPKAPSGIRLITAKVIKGGRIDESRLEYISPEIYDGWMRRGLPQKGDILITTEAPLGEVAQLKTDERVALAQRVILLRPDDGKVDPQFVFHFLRSGEALARLRQRSSGTTVLGIRQPELRAVMVPMLGRRQQASCARFLDTFDELIEVNVRRIEVLEDLARSLYREWFVRFRVPGHEGTDFLDSEIGPVPKGWDVSSLRDLVTTQYGLTASAASDSLGPKFLRGMDINKRSFIDWSSVPGCDADGHQLSRFRLEVGDTCVIRMADPGKVGIIESPVDAVFASYLVRIRSTDPRLPPYLLFHYLNSAEYQGWITGSSTGSTRKSASAAVLVEPRIAIPPAAVAADFERRVRAWRGQLAGLVQMNASLAATRDLLLPRLVTGQLDISEIDLDALLPAESA